MISMYYTTMFQLEEAPTLCIIGKLGNVKEVKNCVDYRCVDLSQGLCTDADNSLSKAIQFEP